MSAKREHIKPPSQRGVPRRGRGSAERAELGKAAFRRRPAGSAPSATPFGPSGHLPQGGRLNMRRFAVARFLLRDLRRRV